LAGFAALYLIWGSTYLATRIALETLPPFLMAGVRFMGAGVVLTLVSRWAGAAAPTGQHWRTAALSGALLLLGGNGLVTFAQLTTPSGLTALAVAVTPAWIVVVGWCWFGERRPGGRVAVGLLVGLVGAVLLLRPTGPAVATWPTVLALALAPVLWAFGSLQSRRLEAAPSATLHSGLQMLCGGALMFATGLVLQEQPQAVSQRSLAAFAYLVVFGSLIAFPTYAWLLRVAQPAAVATYAYVNPLVAVGLGWALAGEQLDWPHAVAGTLVLTAVVLITWPSPPPPNLSEPEPDLK
jgi:drug/metabolite transporter (DMT)-like permease